MGLFDQPPPKKPVGRETQPLYEGNPNFQIDRKGNITVTEPRHDANSVYHNIRGAR